MDSVRFSPRPATRHRFSIAPILVALAALSADAPAGAQPGNYPNQIGPGVYRLDGADPLLPLDDLAPLRRIVGSARYVGLGEGIHTSGG